MDELHQKIEDKKDEIMCHEVNITMLENDIKELTKQLQCLREA